MSLKQVVKGDLEGFLWKKGCPLEDKIIVALGWQNIYNDA